MDKYKKTIEDIVRTALDLDIYNIKEYFYEETVKIKAFFYNGNNFGIKASNIQRKIFENKNFIRYLKKYKLTVEELGIGKNYEDEKELILVVFNDEELGKYDTENLNLRKNRGYPTLPLVIFPESFFNIPNEEVFSYIQIIETIERFTEYKVVAFSENDFIEKNENVNEYFKALSYYVKSYELMKMIDKIKKRIVKIILDLGSIELEEKEVLFQKVWLLAYKEKYEICKSIINLCEKLKKFSLEEMIKIQDKNKDNAIKKRKYFKTRTFSSSFAKDITLKYGNVIKEINKFAIEVANNSIVNNEFEINICLNYTKTLLQENSELGILGTFSSGKTTFINTILSSKHKLRTSAAHNTAVLLKIFLCKENEKEQYKIIYKNKLKINLIKPFKTENTEINNCTEVECISKKEIIVLINEYNLGNIKNLEINLHNNKINKTIKNRKVILVLEKLKEILNHPNEIISIEKINNIIELKGFYEVVLNADYIKKDENIELDDNGWNKFCDSKNTDVFLESPKCFLFTKEIHLQMKSDFLNYCNIVDTPGFGSITETHDAISERYLREHRGILLMMIKVNIQTKKESFLKLFNKIESIYETSNLKKKNVFFILNCFSDSTPKGKLKKDCEELNSLIIKSGFDKERVFVCDLKHSIENNEYLDNMYGYPSYKKFFTIIKTQIENEGILCNIKNIQCKWDEYFKKIINLMEHNNNKLKKEEKNKKYNYEEAKDDLNEIVKIEFLSFNDLKKRYNIGIENFISRVSSLDSKKEWKNNKESIFKYIEKMYREYRENDILKKEFKRKTLGIMEYADIYEDIMEPWNKDTEIFIFPIECFKDKYNEILNRNWGMFWRKRKIFKDELVKFINEEIEETYKNIEENYYKIALKKFFELKNHCKDVVEKKIQRNRPNGTNKEQIKTNELLIENYKKLQIKWNKISKLINKIDEE